MADLLAVIGGTGLTAMADMQAIRQHRLETPYGPPSDFLVEGELGGKRLLFQARHGNPHRLPPHRVNYRANLWALRALDATHVLAVNTVGGINPVFGLADLVIADQIIDYTWGREHTFFQDEARHPDFTYPYDAEMRRRLIEAAGRLARSNPAVRFHSTGCYGCTQGPRLETAAEIRRLARDGCDLVGMTGMPEAILARELELPYACVATIVNKAAGIDGEVILQSTLEKTSVEAARRVTGLLLELLADW